MYILADQLFAEHEVLAPYVKAVTPKTIAFDITDQNEAFEKCDGNVTKDQFGRLVIYETKCKKFSSSRCKLARHSARQEVIWVVKFPREGCKII